ncbi:MAG: dTDP-4-dehydrorhamnose reductase [Nitrospiraceae bacterium]|nr:MAG: dTDP-4-dehydrorhamnose reductase [Nitrospiraceae bacterium]
MKILICGGLGQLGSDCNIVFSKGHEVLSCGSKELDITDLKAMEDKVRGFTPDIIVNCSAYTKVDACETETERAWKVNAEGPKNIALTVKKYGGRIIHVSTDYVFDGKRKPPEAYNEDDETAPLSHYGRSKLEGERAVREIADNYIIVRTSWLYGIHGPNFLKTMLRLVRENPERQIKVVHDQFGSPTWSYRLAQQINTLIEQNCQGLYHASSGGSCTWYELARYFLDQLGIKYTIVPCTTEEYPTPAIRPKNSILENRNLKAGGVNVMLHWKRDIEDFVRLFKAPLIDECDAFLRSRDVHAGQSDEEAISKNA